MPLPEDLSKLSPRVQKMFKEIDFYEIQYSELDAIFTEEWKRHFTTDWKKMSDAEVKKQLNSKGLLELLVIFDWINASLESRLDSTHPIGLGPPKS